MPFPYEDSIYKRKLDDKEIEKMPPYKPTLDVIETVTYNLEGTWGHTRPSERVIVMLPPERRDYNLPIFVHEVIHNFRPGWSEEKVRMAAYNDATAAAAIASLNFTYKRA